MPYIVKRTDGERAQVRVYVCSTHLGTTGVPVFNWCERENDAHQFDTEAAAEAIAFLAGGIAYWFVV